MIEPFTVTSGDWIAAYPPPRSLPLDQEALRIYERAYYIGIQTEPEDVPPVSFTTVIAALLVGDDDTSRWFSERAQQWGPERQAVFDEKKIGNEILDRAAQTTGEPAQVRLSTDKHLLTSSARLVLQVAEDWAQRVGGSDIGVRHLVASYVLNPPPHHRAQMQRWRFKESSWRSAFFEWVAKRFTWEEWSEASHRPLPTRGLPAFDQTKVKGSSLAWPGDSTSMRILERAARDHARRSDRWLRLQTVFHALVETARQDEAVRAAVLPVWAAIQSVDPWYRQAWQKEELQPPADTAYVPFNELDISPRVLNALETARELAGASLVQRPQLPGGELTVSALHLAGALLSRRVDGDEELTGLGLDAQRLRIDLIRHAQQYAESEDVWREMLGEEETLQEGRPVDLNSDEPEAVVRLDEQWKEDPLAIRQDVEAFAALLASSSLEPPLSIGLFGPWGSGKTTFLKRLRRSVDRLAREAGATGGSHQPPYVSNIVHVEFNAWHYAEDALVSSLVDTIFRSVGAYMRDDQIVSGKKWSEQKLEALESTRRKVEAAEALKHAAKKALENAEKDLAAKRLTAREKTTSLQAAFDATWKIAKDELQKSSIVKESGVLDVLGDSVRNADELRTRLDSIRSRPARMVADLGWAKSILFAGLVLALPPLVAWLAGKFLNLGETGQLLSSVTALLSVAGLWLRTATAAMTTVDKAMTKVAETYEQRVASEPSVRDAQHELDSARANADIAEVGLRAVREELARAETEAANAVLPAQMLKLVTNRIEDMSYGKELTTLSLARADLQALSHLLRDQRDGPAGPSPAGRPVNRVILYIDDLDRCRPDDVVRVLQIVHMLLAFELFVVVVAVDARWVEQALTQSYPWLTRRDAARADTRMPDKDVPSRDWETAGTPQDYLEKIFQIAFWLEPMTASRAASYLASLVRSPQRDLVTDATPAVAQTHAATTGPYASYGHKVEITAVELDYMRALAAYVGPSPRRVKRLVNAYRLIKARLSDTQLETFVTDRESAGDGPYQIVIGLLVIGTSAQSAGAEIIGELAECDPRQSFDSVIERLRVRSDHPDWRMATRVTDTLMRTQKAKDVTELRGWARKVGRFLLHGPIAELRTRPVVRGDLIAGSQASAAPPRKSPPGVD